MGYFPVDKVVLTLCEVCRRLPPSTRKIGKPDLCQWFSKFIVEVWHNDGKPYIGNILQILCGVQRHLREERNSSVHFLSFHMIFLTMSNERTSQSRSWTSSNSGKGVYWETGTPTGHSGVVCVLPCVVVQNSGV